MNSVIEFYTPTVDELGFRQRLIADPATMSYNAPWTEDGTGCIRQSDEQIQSWYLNYYLPTGMFYAYILVESVPVGEVAISPDSVDARKGMVSIIIDARYRNLGYGGQALRQLCNLAFTSLGYDTLIDAVTVDRNVDRFFAVQGFERVDANTLKLTRQNWSHRELSGGPN